MKFRFTPVNYNHFFSVGDRLAEIWVTGIGGRVEGLLEDPDRGAFKASNSGIGDPYLAMRVGLVGAPALKPEEFAGHQHGFSLYALAGISIPLGQP